MINAICASVLVVSLMSACSAFADECGDAVRDYNSVLSSLTDAMERFSTCVADSKGLKNCSKEFGQLRSVYRQFASVVAIYSRGCETHD